MSRDFKAHAPQTSENDLAKPSTAKPVEISAETDKQKVSETGETGGPTVDPDPTKFGDWSVNGRCVDF